MTEEPDEPQLDFRPQQIKFEADKPMELIPQEAERASPARPEHVEACKQTGKIFSDYLKARKNLLLTKYAHLSAMVPGYWAGGAQVMVACSEGGVVVRFEKKDIAPTIELRAVWTTDAVPASARAFSQNLLICRLSNDAGVLSTDGLPVALHRVSPGSAPEAIAEAKILFQVAIDDPQPAWRAGRPCRATSIRNEFDIKIEGEITQSGVPFVARSRLRLPVGWECIEVYPHFDHREWRPEYAEIWAEADILSAVIAHQTQEKQYQELDPYAGARNNYALLLRQFKAVLDANPHEEVLQKFLHDNPSLLCPLHTQMWPKLPLGKHETDFVFRQPNTRYLLVELERASHNLFVSDGHVSAPLTHARGQTHDWQRYIEDNLATVQRELGLTGITANPDKLVVIGRRQTLSPENVRKLLLMNSSEPSLRIATYDDIYDDAKAVIENLLGPVIDMGPAVQVYFPRAPVSAPIPLAGSKSNTQ